MAITKQAKSKPPAKTARNKATKNSADQLRKDEDFDRNFRQIGSLTALSRLLGFVRDICLAQFMGAGAAADAFLVAFKLPNLFRRLTADGAMTNAFLPVFASVRQSQGRDKALILAAEVQTMLFLVLSLIVVLGEIFMPVIIALLAPGFVDNAPLYEQTIGLARITLPYLPMISLVALWAAVTNAHNRFFGGALAPVILNICLIGGALMIPVFALIGQNDTPSIFALAMPICVAVLIAGTAQMVVMQRMLARIDAELPIARFTLSDNSKKMWRAFLPAALGAGGLQLNLLIDMVLASMVQVGAISWLYYADRIVQLPLGIIGIALGTALLPQLSKLESEDNRKEVANRISHSIHIGGFFAIPATLAVILACQPIILGLFGYGAFTITDGQKAAAALSAYGVGLIAFVVNKIFQPAFFASDRGRLVLKISFLSVGINIAGSLLMMPVLGHVGLALATAVASWVAVIIMGIILIKEGRMPLSSLRIFVPITAASAVMGLVIYGTHHLVMVIASAMVFAQLLALILLVVTGLASYFLVSYWLGTIPPFLFAKLKGARKA